MDVWLVKTTLIVGKNQPNLFVLVVIVADDILNRRESCKHTHVAGTTLEKIDSLFELSVVLRSCWNHADQTVDVLEKNHAK